MIQLAMGVLWGDDEAIKPLPSSIRYPDVNISLSHEEIEIVLDSLNHYRLTVTSEKHMRWASSDRSTINGVYEKIKVDQSRIVDQKIKVFNEGKPWIFCNKCGDMIEIETK